MNRGVSGGEGPAERPGADDVDYLFVLTYGRSGSTLIAGLLNALPGHLIRGENRDAVYHLYRYHRTLADEKAREGVGLHRSTRDPFYGIGDVPLKRSLRLIRELVVGTVLRPKPGTRVTGFKEIRWYHADDAAYVAWLREVFPGARFLLNTRDHAGVLASSWWAEGDPDHNARHLTDIEDRLRAITTSLGPDGYHVHYDDYVADPTVLRGLFDWLGVDWDEELVRSVFAVRHSM